MTMNYNPQLLTFKSTDKLQLPGLLYEPVKKTNKVALFLHGNGSSSIFYSADNMNLFAEHLNSKGLAFFPFNNRGAHYIHTLDTADKEIEYGMAYERIEECVKDIDGAVNYLGTKGYSEFYLIGHSTGANKIVVYNKYKPENKMSKYILLAGGDDTGGYYEMLGKNKFINVLKKTHKEIQKGNGRKLINKYIANLIISYQSLYDTINPDGDYNIFPFLEYMKRLKLSKKPLFGEYKDINEPTLVIYGERDQYCYGDVGKCVEILKSQTTDKSNFTYQIISEADHSFTGQEKKLIDIISAWL